MPTIAIPPPEPLAIRANDVVDGRYRIVQWIADGGMGRVFLAEHVLIGRRFAVKFLHRELASDTQMVKRFMNEALAAGTLGHPHIVESTDMGFTADGVPFIVFEYLEGSLLTEEIYRVGGLPVRRALRIAKQIASALECAHRASIIHLDLKSDNVYLTDKDVARDHVKVFDFGIARFLEADLDKAQRWVVAGTPEYMAPEQVTRPDQVDKRADVYALGVLLYEMLSARRPFDDDDPEVLLHRIVHDAPRRLDRDHVPAELEQMIFERMLAKDRARRFQSMHAVEDAIDGLIARSSGLLGHTSRIVILPMTGLPLPLTPPAPPTLPPTPPARTPLPLAVTPRAPTPLPRPVTQPAPPTLPPVIATPDALGAPASAGWLHGSGTVAARPRRWLLGWLVAALVVAAAGAALANGL